MNKEILETMIKFLKDRSKELERDGLVPTVELIIEDLENLIKTL